MKKYPKRKFNRLQDFDYSAGGAYHIVICSKNRDLIFSEINENTYEICLTPIGKIIDDCIKFLSTKPNQNVEKYVIMPNHIHILLILDDINVEGTQYSNRLGVFVSSLKRFTNKKFGRDLWQRSYYDNIIRDEEIFFEIWQYIDENPIKWTLDEYYRNPIKR